jgi:tRNA (guanine-N7-)-methyltransferase
MPRYGLAASGPPVDPESLFGAPLPLAVEFGSGTGEAALEMARSRPDIGIIAVDVHTPGVGRLLRGIEAEGIGNIRVVHGDGVALLRERIPEGRLAAFRAFFPDPWPKARHHKRRLVRGELMALVSSRLQPGGTVHLATDWQHYAEQMVAVLQEAPGLTLVDRDRAAVPPRPATRFERKALLEGRTVTELFAVATHR